ncbi:aminotransferase [Mesorhizobium sp. MSK_1335]|uniref:Aminotransferase n=1 Tax=Mesorhizobium montanum TaxID=3072323 RepID=A0ABU4ZUQ6_9HYPH|nr:aminotransferase [Mesorhizobium sp. MSK_1335]MDX8529148.1 aminotransferase [Mesorhizobium sp. MSK_1335]
MRSNFAYDTDRLVQEDQTHILHPWGDLGEPASRNPMIIAEAEGVYVYNSDGHRMLDGIGGLWCVNIGYGREEMVQAIADQVRKLPYCSNFGITATPKSIEFGTRLAGYTPGDLKRVLFTTGGSTAVDSALRFVQFYFNSTGRPNKKHIITRNYAYHGSTYLSASVSGKPGDRGNLDFVTDTVHHLPVPDPYRRPEGMTEEEFCDLKVADLENKILELGPENVGCFIAEPLLASGGVIVPPAGYQKRTRDVCSKYHVLYISDEVVTGFGRLGEIFASEPVFEIVPDIITSAKGLTSGYIPLGAVFISERLYGEVSGEAARGKQFANGFTYSGHPVACAAGLKNLDIIESENILGHVRDLGNYFIESLSKLEELPIVGIVRGSHLVACVECVADKKTKEPVPASFDIGNRIGVHARARGLMVRPMGHLAVLSPPLIVTREQIDTIVEIMEQAINAAVDDLVREGLWNK